MFLYSIAAYIPLEGMSDIVELYSDPTDEDGESYRALPFSFWKKNIAFSCENF